MSKTLVIGTRGSKLSLWQARHIADLARTRFQDLRIELVTIKTRGDHDRESPLPDIGGAGVFTSALEAALRRGEIDCAVHSLKDLPTKDADGLIIGAISKRGDHRDALVSRQGGTLAQLPRGACVGTGSPRRRAQLLRLRPDLQLRNIRGNVPTRIDKLFAVDGPYDAIVLAVAGLDRLGLSHHISEIFEIERMMSAAGQGAIAVQYLKDSEWADRFAALNDQQTAQATTAERAFLRTLEAGCSTPVGAYAHVEGGTLKLRARVMSFDGAEQVNVCGEAGSYDGPAGADLARQLGLRLAEQALERGAAGIPQDLIADRDER